MASLRQAVALLLAFLAASAGGTILREAGGPPAAAVHDADGPPLVPRAAMGALRDAVPHDADLQAPLLAAARLAGLDAQRAQRAPHAGTLADAVAALAVADGAPLDVGETLALRATALALPPELADALAPLVRGVADAQAHLGRAWAQRPAEARDAADACTRADAAAVRAPVAGPDVHDVGPALDAALIVLASVEGALPRLREAAPLGPPGTFALDPRGLVVLAGPGPSRIDADAARAARLLVDLGGDDRYESAAGATPCRARTAGGDEPTRVAFGGVSVSIDLAGNDTYEPVATNEPEIGSAEFFGVGLLIDLDGDDAYTADMFAIGYAEDQSVGAVLDLRGNDTYAVSAFGQGAAALGSLGVLADRMGDDLYAGLGAEREGRFLMQGASMLRAVGLLVDGDGDDRYWTRSLATRDCLCQGATFASAAGVLYDRRGDDRYETNAGRAYVLLGGVATMRHSGLALFVDHGGRDAYVGGAAGSNDETWRTIQTNALLGYGVDCEPPDRFCELL